MDMWIQGAWGMASCGEEELGLTFVKEEVPNSILAKGEWIHDGDR
jgi:hypothetical protein